ncbi:MAG TPA: ROK family transcriptional regulator [Jatrophihabitans sp.]|uniref:ROK family transcriptional regulator n=1 Tax=Jatrophihabitans sp. TaxID=1932789 RepID=UPI002EE44B8B
MAAQRVAVRPEEIRRHNLSRLLRSIHQHGELTRADLTAAMGLNRSTIGALVSDLVALGLVTEFVPSGGDRAGRPSHLVAPRPDGPYVLAVDVAVERIVTAAVGLGGTVHERRDTPIDGADRLPRAVVGQIVADAAWLADRLPGSQGPVGVGVSIPGTVRRRDGFVEHAPNLDWRAVPFAELLAARMPNQLDVQAGNDADLGAVAEHQRGVAIGYDHMVYLNGSVGVGSGIIAEGNQLHGVGGYAGEIGHMTINPDGPPCHCGSTGCIETYIGEHALLRAAGVTDRHGPQAVAAVFEAAATGEERAAAAVRTVALWLGRSLANVVNCFNPQAIVVGGSLAEVVRLDRATVEGELDRRAMAAARAGVQVLLPGLDQDSALIGAAELAFQTLLTSPDSLVVSLAAT